MKKFTHLLFILSICCSLQTIAQDSLITANEQLVFSQLNTGRIQTGFLIDKVLNPIIPIDSGTTFDTVASVNAWDQAYFQMRHADLNNFLPNLDQVVEQRNSVFAIHQAVPLMMMYLQYNSIASDALDNGALLWNADSTILLEGDSTVGAYNQNVLFMNYPTSKYFNEDIRLWISRDFLFSNVPEIGSYNLYIDGHDGRGPIFVPWESVYTAHINAENPHTHAITIYLNAADLVNQHDVLITVERYDPYKHAQINSLWNYSVEIQATIPYDGVLGKAKYDVKFGNDHGQPHDCFKKPYVIVEGVDFGYKNHRRGYYGDGRPPYKFGTLGFIDILGEGKSYNMEDGPTGKWSPPDDLTIFKEGKNMVTQLNDMGYDVIYFDFFDGADLIQRNAFALVELLNEINAIKCTNEEIVVMGASMGGQVARYALSYMEKHDIKHCTRLYESFDSPQKGAHIPLAIQGTLISTANLLETANELKTQMLERPAAFQLLLLSGNKMACIGTGTVKNGNEVITIGLCGSQHHSLRDTYLGELISFDNYPKTTRNVAISCGSGVGTGNALLASGSNFYLGELAGFTTRNNIFGKPMRVGVNISIAGLAGRGITFPSEIDKTNKPNTVSIFKGVLNDPNLGRIVRKERFVTVDNNLLLMDGVPGGGRNDMSTLKDELKKLEGTTLSFDGSSISIEASSFNNFGINMFTFISAISALDFNTTDFNENMDLTLGGIKDIPQPQFHPWEAIYYNPANSAVRDPISHTRLINLPHVWISCFGKYGSNEGNKILSGETSPSNTEGNADWGIKQTLINEDMIKGNLPNINYYTGQPLNYINLGALSRDVITSCTIGTNGVGVLQINGNNPITRIKYNLNSLNYEQDPDLNLIPLTGSSFEATTCNCEEALITIGADGLIKVGDDNALNDLNNKGILRIRSGAILRIMDGGTLKIFNGSKVIIEAGAILEYYPGANIVLQGENSELLIQGKIELYNGAVFNTKQGLSNIGGKVIAERTPGNNGTAFTAYPPGGGSVFMAPQTGNPDQVMLVLRGGIINPTSLSSFKLDHVVVQSETNSGLEPFTSNIEITNSRFEGTGSNAKGLLTLGQSNVSISATKFVNLDIGLLVNNMYYSVTDPVMVNLNFTNCANGIIYSGLKLHANQFQFITCGTGILASELTQTSTFEHCFFNFGDDGISIQNNSTDIIFTNNNFNHLLGNGISTTLGQYVLQCNMFNACATGLYTIGGIVSLSPAKIINGISGGDNTFQNCGTGIFSNLTEISLENGQNNFINTVTAGPFNFLGGNVSYTNLSAGNTLAAQNNYFFPVPLGNDLSNATSDWYYLETLLPVNPHYAQVSLTGNTLGSQSTACSNIIDQNNNNTNSLAVLDNISFPNPVTTNTLTVTADVLVGNSLLTFNVLDNTGLLRLNLFTNSGAAAIGATFNITGLSTLSPGMYYLQIITPTQVLYFPFIKI